MEQNQVFCRGLSDKILNFQFLKTCTNVKGKSNEMCLLINACRSEQEKKSVASGKGRYTKNV